LPIPARIAVSKKFCRAERRDRIETDGRRQANPLESQVLCRWGTPFFVGLPANGGWGCLIRWRGLPQRRGGLPRRGRL